jgi:RNA polymerase sigma factor (sigma-70 family)
MTDVDRLATDADGLIQRARAGDADAENALFEKLRARVFSLAKKKVWDVQVAEDLTQETIQTVLEKYRDAEMLRGFLPWVFTILHNKVGNHIKRRRAEAARLAPESAIGAWETVGVTDGGAVAAIDLAESLEKAFRDLSPECRKVFALLLADAGRGEIRSAFGGEPIGTVDSRVSRCREKLLGQLEALWKERVRR